MDTKNRLAIAMLAAAATAIPAGARAQSGGATAKQENNLTVYGGYRFGGGFTDVTTGKSWEMTEGPSFAVAADFGIDRQTQWELFVSYRNSALKASGFSPVADNIGVGITYAHLGGTYFFEGVVGKGGYVVGGLGLTNFSPSGTGLSSETRGSINLGIGFMVPLAQHVALKLEARGYATLVNSSGSFFCSGGCVVQISGTTFTQGDLLMGIAARF